LRKATTASARFFGIGAESDIAMLTGPPAPP
jgi:hypothetical protein